MTVRPPLVMKMPVSIQRQVGQAIRLPRHGRRNRLPHLTQARQPVLQRPGRQRRHDPRLRKRDLAERAGSIEDRIADGAAAT